MEDANGNFTINLTYDNAGTGDQSTTADLKAAVEKILGTGSVFDIATNQVSITNATDSTGSIALGGSALSKLGLTAGETKATSSFAGQTLTIGAIDGSAA